MEQETIDRLNQRTDAERFNIDKTLLNPCRCGLKPRVSSVTYGQGDFGPEIHCSCGLSVKPYYWDNGKIVKMWNEINPI